jgi:hypothetical protein
MWQYTTETIINSLDGKLTGGKKIVVTNTKANGGKLLIEGVGAFDLDKIEGAKIWKREYQPAQAAKAVLNLKTTTLATTKEVYRLQIWVSEEGTIRPELQNAFLKKSIPFSFEVEAANKATLLTNLEKVINGLNLKKGAEKLFTVAVDTTAETLTVTATDCYVRFDEVRLDLVADSANLTGYKDYSDVAIVEKADMSKSPNVLGTEGNGTVARLVKNLRIPTKTSLDPFGAYQGGKPVPGGKYNQYMFEYVTDRSHVGHQVFGSVGDQSLTTHILFIEGYDETAGAVSGASAEFETLLNNKGITVAKYAPTTASVANAQEGRGAKK